ncbi:MAG: hypothetical protein MR537_05630 [Clostridiales bacterium]|nr:hypothetical protein [Clostridiales bacterium]
MAEFKPIETQEELDAFAGKIRKEATERTESRFADYEELKSSNAALKEQLATAEKEAAATAEKYKDYDQNISNLQDKVNKYEIDAMRTRVALAAGLPYEAAGRLKGETEDEIKKDAEAFSGMMKLKKQPLADPEPIVSKKGAKRAAMKDMLHKMTGGNE